MRPLRPFLQQTQKGFLPGLFVGALALRLGFVFYFSARHPEPVFPDSRQFDLVAENVLAGRGFMVEENRLAARPPLYPLFMVLCGRKPILVRCAQAFLGAATCLLVYLLARTLFESEAAAKLAGMGAALDPFLVFFTGLELSEIPFILLLLAAMVWLAKSAKQFSAHRAVLAGFLLGLGILTRPSLLLFPLFLFSVCLVVLESRWDGLKLWGWMLLACAAAQAPWVIRNYCVLRAFVPTTTQGGESLWEANNPLAHGEPMMDDPNLWPSGSETMGELERDAFLRDRAVRFIRENPGRFLHLGVLKFLRFWNVVPNFSGYRGLLYVAISLASTVPVYLLALWGVRVAWRQNRHAALICLSPIVYTCALHCVFVGSLRYRVPIIPYLLCFAALGLVSLLRLESAPSQTTACPAQS